MEKRYGAQVDSQWEECGEQCKERLRSDGKDEKADNTSTYLEEQILGTTFPQNSVEPYLIEPLILERECSSKEI